MLHTIRIRNYRSIHDVTVTLQKVNLFIGPNNSGKSNFLKALKFWGELVKGQYPKKEYPNIPFFGKREIEFSNEYIDLEDDDTGISFEHQIERPKGFYKISSSLEEKQLLLKYAESHYIYSKINYFGLSRQRRIMNNWTNSVYYRLYGISDYPIFPKELVFAEHKIVENNFSFYELNDSAHKVEDLAVEIHGNSKYNYSFSFLKKQKADEPDKFDLIRSEYYIFENNKVLRLLLEDLVDISIYQINPVLLKDPYPIKDENKVIEDASNLIGFLQTLRDKHEDIYQKISRDLNRYLPEFTTINFDTVTLPDSNPVRLRHGALSYKKLGLSGKDKKIYWAEELSEGTLFFLALLCIIHQPNPPKLIMLEEPEKGIHPRRIKEVMDLIFDLVEEKDIQVIITSHSTQMLDQFEDRPESVFIFDMEEGETIVKNLQTDIIEKSDKILEEKGLTPINYLENLSEHWVMGFLGGVPE